MMCARKNYGIGVRVAWYLEFGLRSTAVVQPEMVARFEIDGNSTVWMSLCFWEGRVGGVRHGYLAF